MSEVRIATRASALALAQAQLVGRMLETARPGVEVRIVAVTTRGDIDRTSPVSTLTEVGAFVRAVQHAVLDGDADIAVHSCKDLPVTGPDGLAVYYPTRASPWDVLCGSGLADLTHGATVGTGSPRRSAQLRLLRPDVDVVDIRGNVDSRLAKAEGGEVGAVVLAEAGLLRMGMADRIRTRFDVTEMVPAPAQGALAVEALEGSPLRGLLTAIDHAPTRAAVTAERHLLALSGAGCRAALGAVALPEGNELVMWGFVEEADGPRTAHARDGDPLRVAELVRRGLGV